MIGFDQVGASAVAKMLVDKTFSRSSRQQVKPPPRSKLSHRRLADCGMEGEDLYEVRLSKKVHHFMSYSQHQRYCLLCCSICKDAQNLEECVQMHRDKGRSSRLGHHVCSCCQDCAEEAKKMYPTMRKARDLSVSLTLCSQKNRISSSEHQGKSCFEIWHTASFLPMPLCVTPGFAELYQAAPVGRPAKKTDRASPAAAAAGGDGGGDSKVSRKRKETDTPAKSTGSAAVRVRTRSAAGAAAEHGRGSGKKSRGMVASDDDGN